MLEEFFAGLQSGARASKPDPEAVAAAVQAVQRFAAESDSEQAVNAVLESEPDGRACVACGNQNPRQNTFCATCGVPLLDVPPGEVDLAPAKAVPATQPAGEPKGQHYYHHHYHHHYFEGEGSRNGGLDLRSGNAVVKDATRARVAQGSTAFNSTSLDAPSTGAPLSRAESAVRKFTRDWAQACNTRHLDDLVELYAVDATVMRANLPVVRGAAAIREFFFAALDAGLGDVEFEPVRVELLGDVAYEAGRCKMLVPGVQGKRREERGKYLVILRREAGGEWKAVADSWSSDLSLTEPGATMQNSGGLMRPPRKTA